MLVTCVLVTLFAAQIPTISSATGAPIQDQDADDTGLNEQTIYIPYDELRDVFERDGRGVFLTYEKFQQLWDAARANRVVPLPITRPVGPVIQEINSVAEIGDAVVVVTADLQIEIPPSGWSEVPLRLADAAIRTAQIGDQPARIVFDGQSGYKLIVENPGEDAIQIELHLEYLKAYQKTPGASSFQVAAPQATINRWSVLVPEEGVDVTIEPTIAATRTTPEDATGDTTEQLIAFVGAADQVRLLWNPKSEGAAGLEAFATVRSEQQLVIGEGVVRTVNQLAYDISRAAIETLTVRLPLDQKVINVFDRNVKRWDVVADDSHQTLNVELFEPARDSQNLVIELERFIDTEVATDLQAPLVEALNVGRQQGIVVARLEDGLQGEAIQRVGLLQLDPSELSANLQATTWDFAFRYGAIPYDLRLAVRKLAPRIHVAERIGVRLSAQELALTWMGDFNIQDAGVFQLAIEIPEQYEVRTMVGTPSLGGAPAAVESFHRDGDSATRWLVNLSQRAFGRTGLQIELRLALDDANLREPTGEASELAVDLPHVADDSVEHREGTVVISSPETLRVNPSTTSGLRPVSFEQTIIPSELMTNPSGELTRLVLAFAFSAGTTDLALSAERRRPYVSTRQLLVSEIEAGVIKHSATFHYEIRYSGVQSLRIDLPVDIAAKARNLSTQMRRTELDPQPDDVAEGYVAWEMSTESELLGTHQIQLEWEDKIEELGLGTSIDFDVPKLMPVGVDRATGQLVTVKAESIDIYPIGEPTGLRGIDPQNDLMPEANVEDAAMAFEFVDDWSLSMRATRYELEDSKPTSIERGVVRVVVLPQGELSVQALYRLKSAKQRVPIRLPDDAEFDSQPMRINGQSVTPERDANGTIFVPLAGYSLNDSVVLELRFSVPGGADTLSLPEFVDDPAVQKVFLCAYLSPDLSLIGSNGAWTDEELNISPIEEEAVDPFSDAELISWVCEGTEIVGSSATSFPIGKNELYVFSALRPEGGENGSLSLKTMNRRVLQGLVFLAIAVIGLPLYGRSIRLQVAAVGLIVVGLMVIGVFLPRLSIAVLNEALWASIATVGVVWVVGHARGMIKSLGQQPTRVAGRNVPAPPVVTDEPPIGTAPVGTLPSGVGPTGTAPINLASSPHQTLIMDDEDDPAPGDRVDPSDEENTEGRS